MLDREIDNRIWSAYHANPIEDCVSYLIASGVSERTLADRLRQQMLIPAPFKNAVQNCFRDHTQIRKGASNEDF